MKLIMINIENMLYILLAPLVSFVLYKKINQIIIDIKLDNTSKIKANVFFLLLIILISVALVLLIEYV